MTTLNRLVQELIDGKKSVAVYFLSGNHVTGILKKLEGGICELEKNHDTSLGKSSKFTIEQIERIDY